MIAMAFVFLCAGAWAQSKVTVESGISKSGSLVLEVRGVDDASVSATPVERISPNGKQLYCAYDIDITKNGREWQPEPEQPAMVSMENTNFADGQLLDIYHEGANGLEFVATVASENGKITFPAHSFSVYIVTAAGDYARLKVNLHQADGTVVTIYVKKQDITDGDFSRIVYNPGMGADNLADGVKCMGWVASADGNYTVADTANALSFDGVRDRIRTQLNNGVTDGTELNFYAMLFKLYSVTYLGENNSVYETDELLYRADAATSPAISYTVNANYTPGENSRNFEGWKVNSSSDGSHISGHSDNDHNYTNLTDITVTGDVAFKAHVTEGYWLIYHENGHGATYKAADFVHAGDVTEAPELEMLRNGYTFRGWYTGAPATTGGTPTGSPFNFGARLEENTHVYANWEPVATANYTVIIWKQNIECDGYDFEESINLTGNTNTRVGTVVPNGSGNSRYASVNGVRKEYTGFYLSDYDTNVTITPEGNALVNVYYDRIEYTVKFIYYRKNGSNKYQYATNKLSLDENSSATGNNYLCARWSTNTYNNHPVSDYPSRDTIMGSYTYTYYPITAKYGQSIADKWPQYDKFRDFDNRRFSSWVVMIGARARGNGHGEISGQGSVKGLISIMDEQILGDMTSSNGNYLVAKYSNSADDWTYKIWFPKVDGEDYTEIACTTVNNVGYYLGYDIQARSGSGVDGQHQPSFIGFNELDGNQRGNEYIMDYYYSRIASKIIYMDGAYFNGNDINLADYIPNGRPYREVSGISYMDNISSYADYVPTAPDGFMFEGWYTDEPCTHPYIFNRMPSASVTVYAKWRQIQYRVFLHPNANPDIIPDLDWGASDQALNFRIACGSHISTPTGVSEEHEFVGWYTNSECTQAFNETAVVLNESTVTEPYDKTTDFTDDMDKYGNGATYNKDAINDRFWITKKFDLYGKWRAKLRGANGITVIYVDNMETPTTIDTARYYYQDNVKAIARDAIPSRDANKEFSHWVLQNFNSTDSVYEDIPGSRIFPGDLFSVLKDNSKRAILEWHNPEDIEDLYSGIVDPNNLTPPNNTHSEYGASYTIYLRAEYVDLESPEYTSLVWLMNDGSGDTVRTDGLVRGERTLPINEAVVPPVPTRTGYIFNGWYKKNVSSGPLPVSIATCDPNFLYYKNNTYYRNAACGVADTASRVIADLHNLNDYMYAIWEPDVKFSFDPICPGSQIELPTTTEANVDLSGSWAASSGTISGTTYTADNVYNGEVTLTFTPESSTCAKEKEFSVSVEELNIPNVSSYDYIWKGGANSRARDWDAASNWYVYNNRAYSVATELPTSEKNIYIGDYTCNNNIIPTVDGSNAYAKNITIVRDASLKVPAGKTLNIAGNLDNIGILEATEGKIVFCGSENGENQTITRSIKLGEVTFNNRGGNIVPEGNVTINGVATFINGVVEGDVTFSDNSSVVENMTYKSFVDGEVTKAGSANGFTFPTGNNNVLGKVKTMSNVYDVSVQYFNNPDGFDISEYPRWWNVADNCSDNDPRLDHVSNFEYWSIQSSGALNATLTVSAADSSAHFNPISPTHDGNDIYGAFWTGSCWANIGGVNHTISNNPYGNISVEVVIPATRATSDKILSLGSIDHNTVLPIELTSFTANCDGRSALVKWTTATEKNNDYFSLERSDDAINFVEIARIAGAGNSIEPLNYSYNDYGIYGGENYYRLVQVDYDGTRTASEIIVVDCVETAGEPDVLAYPNPFNNELTLELDNFGNRATNIEVYDMLGRLVYVEQADAPQNRYETILNFSNLHNGAYNIRVSTSDFVINKQVVKQ